MLALAALLTACNRTPQETTQAPARSKTLPAHPVRAVTIEAQTLHLDYHLAGHLQAERRARIYNEESGRILRAPFDVGAQVKKGQLLLAMDDSRIRADLSRAQSTLQQAQLDLKRLRQLLPKKIATEEEVAQAQTEVSLARADIAYQRERLSRSKVYAPFDGIIAERRHEAGEVVPAQTHVLTLIDPRSLLARFDVSEDLLAVIQPGQPLGLRLDSLAGENIPARVKRILPLIDSRTLSGAIEAAPEALPATARSGQFVRGELRLDIEHVLLAPSRAIQLDANGRYVFRLLQKQGKTVAVKTPVETGRQSGGQTIVRAGLQAGDKIVSRGFLGLRDGKTVRLQPAQAASP